MSKPEAPEPPDYSQVAKASAKSARLSFRLAKNQLEWAKKTYRLDSKKYDKVLKSFMSDMRKSSRNADEDREFYETNFQTLEKELADEARTYDTVERRQEEMGKASSGVAEQFNAARENATQQLEAYGIDPSSTRYAALDVGLRTNQAATQAAASTQAEQGVEDRARQLKAAAVTIGRGYPAQVASSYGTSGAMGSGASGIVGQNTTIGGQTMGTTPQYMQLGNSATQGWGNILHQGYTDQLNQFNANQQASSGWGSLAGMLGGMALKTWAVADGGVIPEQGEENYGGPVDEEMSPSGGQEVDDVPARLNAGEFVIPDDVVSWFGEKHFYNLIDKTAKEREEAKQKTGAIPEEGYMPVEQPQFQSA